MPKVHRVTDPRLCGAVTVSTGLNTKVFAEQLLVAVVGDLDSHNMMGALQSMTSGKVMVQGIPLIVSLMDQGLPDMIGLIQHVTGLPTPSGGAQKVFAYGTAGTFGGGLGNFGMGGLPNVGEMMKLGSQSIGEVYRIANQSFDSLSGIGEGILVMSGMNPSIQSMLSSGTTLVGASSGNSFTFSNYFSS